MDELCRNVSCTQWMWGLPCNCEKIAKGFLKSVHNCKSYKAEWPGADDPAVSVSSMSEKFWVVWNPRGGNPKVRHISKQDAIAEAKRIAGLGSGQTYVLENVGSAERIASPVVWNCVGETGESL